MNDAQNHRPNPESGNSKLTEVWFRIEKDADGYPQSKSWEGLWAVKSADGNFVIRSIPFYLKNVSAGDTVEAEMGDFLAFTRVVARGGHHTYRLFISKDHQVEIHEIENELVSLGLAVEKDIGILLAVDVPPTVDQRAIDAFLLKGAEEMRWEMQDGFLNSILTT
jgi:hypothetical protein